jgi:hypothetical protein
LMASMLRRRQKMEILLSMNNYLMRVVRESLYAGDLNACYVDSNSVSELEPSLYLNKMQRCGGYSRRNCG